MARIHHGLVLAALSLTPLMTGACAAQHADGTPAPETSRSAVDSAPPADPAIVGDTSDETTTDPTSEPIARRPPPPAPLPPPIFRPVPSSPYRVEVLGDSSNRLATFHHIGRTYVLGTIGSRYRIHVTNPTSRRVEAVVSVDGLDAIDGTAADYAHKSGYVIAPYGDVVIDGFRTSLDEVATFRFSSVRDSYAGRKGVDRNVGVIGVAFFAERDRPPPPPPRPRPVSPHYYDAPSAASPTAPASGAGASPSDNRSSAADESASSDFEQAPPTAAPSAGGRAAPQPKRERAGLGTEFGEQRSSVVEYTEFQRADGSHPTAVAELRYNDRDGLIALGIPLRSPPPSEIGLRETASPFPVNRFASAPPAY